MEPINLRPGQGVCNENYSAKRWARSDANQLQRVPLCAAYRIKVKLADDAPIPLQVAGSVLSATGRMDSLPSGDQRSITLWKTPDGKGMETTLGAFQAGPDSLNVDEYVYVLGLPLDMTIPWNLLSTGTKQASLEDAALGKREYGTYSTVAIRTIANSGFGESEDETLSPLTREYTISDFDITPYLPDGKESSALYRILKSADGLARGVSTPLGLDGVPYKQHAWCKGTTEKNLSAGIDCSRSIWYVFTRAGLPYNRYAETLPDEAMCVAPYDPSQDGYLYTGDMARKNYLMADNFEDCLSPNSDGEVQFDIGDVLVYRDSVHGDGHTVMVIDPEKRIAWGSHGWDGEPRLIEQQTGVRPDQDRGVEYQKIKIKTDWQKWDRGTMTLRACWRHKSFVAERSVPAKQPGLAAICEKALKPETAYFANSICKRILTAVDQLEQ